MIQPSELEALDRSATIRHFTNLSFSFSHSPCLVANLWDVTDRDIDRFLEQLLKSWLTGDESGSKKSLLDYMSEARRACKLQYLIGASPVVYGLPVYLNRKVNNGGV